MTSYINNAHLIGDEVFILNKADTSQALIFSLDLNNWVWKCHTPEGPPPPDVIDLCSIVHDGKIHFFIGDDVVPPSNQLFSYNISTNSWEWPNIQGDIPSPRHCPVMTVSQDTVYLSGGFGGENIGYKDLYILDMRRFEWKKVYDYDVTPYETGAGPETIMDAQSHSITCISHSTALVVGAYSSISHKSPNSITCDNWIMNLDNAKHLMEPSSIWTKISSEIPRTYHAAVLQPLSKELWIIGGFFGFTSDEALMTSDLLKIDYKGPKLLKDLALDSVAHHICAHDPRLNKHEIPEQLKNEIDVYKQETGMESYEELQLRLR